MWFVIGVVVAAGVTVLVLWLRNRNIAVTWYDWLIGAIGLLLVLAAIQHYTGALAEGFPTAGWLGLLVFGIPALILLVVAWQLIARRQRAG